MYFFLKEVEKYQAQELVDKQVEEAEDMDGVENMDDVEDMDSVEHSDDHYLEPGWDPAGEQQQAFGVEVSSHECSRNTVR